jgi:hypothetical protein
VRPHEQTVQSFLFNAIAPVYGLFYSRQKKRYREVINAMQPNSTSLH